MDVSQKITGWKKGAATAVTLAGGVPSIIFNKLGDDVIEIFACNDIHLIYERTTDSGNSAGQRPTHGGESLLYSS